MKFNTGNLPGKREGRVGRRVGAFDIRTNDLAAVLTSFRQTWGNKTPGATVEPVKKVRSEIAGRKEPTTAAERLKIPVAE